MKVFISSSVRTLRRPREAGNVGSALACRRAPAALGLLRHCGTSGNCPSPNRSSGLMPKNSMMAPMMSSVVRLMPPPPIGI